MGESLFEMLESRQMLSVSVASLAAAPPAGSAIVMAPMVATSALKVGTYEGSATLDGLTGKFALKVSSVAGTAVTGILSSAAWGGFKVTVTGTFSSTRTLTLTGASGTCRLKSFSGKLASDNKTVTGTLSITQMGVALKASVKVVRVVTASVLKAPVVLNLSGTHFRGSVSDGTRNGFRITRQTGGLFWGTFDSGDKMTGFIAAGNKVRLVASKPSGHSTAKAQATSTTMVGSWSWFGTNGDRESGTFSFSRA